MPHAPGLQIRAARKLPGIPSPRSARIPDHLLAELTAVSAVGAPPSRGTCQSWPPRFWMDPVQCARITVEVHHRTGEHSASGIGDGSCRTTAPSLPITTRPLSAQHQLRAVGCRRAPGRGTCRVRRVRQLLVAGEVDPF